MQTNVMRLLSQKDIVYKSYDYADTAAVSGTDVALVLGQDSARVFKTLVTECKSGGHYVFVIPVAEELDLKKAAKSVGEKSINMIKARELLPLTGYEHGGCSPIGMKKAFPTVIDRSAESIGSFCFSAGKIGYQVEVSLDDLGKLIKFQLAELTN